MVRLSLALIVLSMLDATAVGGDIRLQGRVVDQSRLALPGVSLRLVPAAVASAQATAEGTRTSVTAGDGTFSFDVAAGDYRLYADLDGFQRASRDVRALEPTILPDLLMSVAHFSEETTVVATLRTEIQPSQFGAPATIAAQVIENAPLHTNRYDDMLPLLPNVVRGPDGLVSVAGARAPQGVVLLNGIPASDIASGDPLAPVPLGAVENVQVIATGFPVEFGPATGGVTLINSRSGGDAFRFTVNSFTPRPRLADGSVEGIEAWEPNTSLRGPIVPGRALFAQSFDYHFEKMRAETVDGAQDRREHGFTSFTQVDAKAGGGHVLTGWFNGQKQHMEGEHLGAFTPLGTVPVMDRSTWGGAAIDRVAFGASTLETRLGVRHQDVSLSPDGTGAYLVGHDVTRGAYFSAVDRHALSVEAATVFSRASAGRFGRHLLKAGVAVGRRTLDGLERDRPVTYLRSSLVPAMTVDFIGSGCYGATSTQLGAFVQDAWDLNDRTRLDVGIRLDHDTRTDTFGAPRVGVTWIASQRTTLSTGFGWFAGDTPLAALAFDGYQMRQVTTFDESGVAVGTPVAYRNVLSGDLERPRARIWSARVDWRLGVNWQLRAAFQERWGTREAIVSPAVLAGDTVALLSATGESHARSFETTLGYHPSGRPHQFYVSYVRSASTGNTGDFGQTEGLFRDPRLDPAETAPLPADVPHRVLVWGLFSLPARVTVAPFLDVRSGFPYSAIGDDWSYAGPRFAQRYPLFASLDLVVNKIVTLPGGVRARAGIKLYNVVGRRNGREVQADIGRPDFGQTYNALGRQVRGVFEIIWNSGRRQ